MKIYKMLTVSLLTSVIFILCINAIYINDPQNSIGGSQDNFYQNELTNYDGTNFDSPKSSATLTAKTAYAIVVGISDYPGTGSDLSYCDDDAQDIYSLLINDFNFKIENVIYLQDSSATKGAISSAFDQIASQISSDDLFFFYYSGHGGYGTEVGPYSWIAETPHNYPNNYDNTWSVSRTGAEYMRVHFSRLDCESGYDYLLCGDSDVTSGYYYELYSGNYGYDFWSAYIPVSRYYLRFVSDYSYTYYGFRVDSYEAILDDGTHYLCSYDSIPNSPSNYYVDSLIDSKLDNINCAEKYVAVDSCHSGGIIPEVQEIGRYIMTACQADEYSLENPTLQHGVFTNYFLQSFDLATDSNADGIISMEESYSYTSSNTISFSAGAGYTHHPQQSDGISGESVLLTAFGALSLTPTGNSLSYSFHMYGTGLIEELRIAVYNISETIAYAVEDLTESPASNTGFGYYSGTILLNGVTGISDYGLFARISGNEVIFLNQTVSSDSDSDGIDNITEIMFGMNASNPDSDSDGLNDYDEFYGITDPLSNDTDNDGMGDFYEVNNNLNPIVDDSSDDEDGDGLTNLLEHQLGSFANNSDSDNDGMDDYWEFFNSLDLLVDDGALDPDFDNILNIYEYGNNTNPYNADTDGDTIDDGDEILTYLTNPTIIDTDGDGLTDPFEIFIFFTNPNNQDTESDGMDDSFEYIYGLDPFIDDSDLDLDNDGLINLLEYQCGTYPDVSDSDGDFMTDCYEYDCHLNPLTDDANLDYDNDGLSNLLEFLLNSLADETDSDNDLMPDGWEYNNGLDLMVIDANLDEDNDGLHNLGEFQAHTDPNNQDTDADGLFDGSEVNTYFTDPVNPDSDGDGYSDGIEVQWGTDPLDPKISLNTFFFNIAGIAILVSSSYFVIRATLTNKKQKALVKSVKNKLNIAKKPKVYNAVNVEKKFKPKPKPKPKPYTSPRSSYTQSYSRPSYPQSRPSYGSTNIDANKIKDLILYGLPPPKSIYSAEGIKAQNIANLGFRYIDQGRFKEGFDHMITALILGVPEPINSRIKTILLKSINQFSSASQPSTTIRKPINSKTCGWCGKQNRISNKYCANCGRPI